MEDKGVYMDMDLEEEEEEEDFNYIKGEETSAQYEYANLSDEEEFNSVKTPRNYKSRADSGTIGSLTGEAYGYEDYNSVKGEEEEEEEEELDQRQSKASLIEDKKPNFKCGKCKLLFFLEKNQKMIRCANCGYRILFKTRTTNYILYKTE